MGFESGRMFVLLVLCLASVSAFRMGTFRRSAPAQSPYRGPLRMSQEIDTGEFDCELQQTDFKSTKAMNLFEYELKAKIPAKEMKSYLEEYKDEMKKRKVVFPGFRPGKLPPYVMGDVRKYIVSYGLETILGGLANLNDMQLVTEDGEDVPFGEDDYYSSIIQTDDQGRNFEQIRDAWKENQDFSFIDKFFAIVDMEEEAGGEDSTTSDGESVAIDTEIVEGDSEE